MRVILPSLVTYLLSLALVASVSAQAPFTSQQLDELLVLARAGKVNGTTTKCQTLQSVAGGVANGGVLGGIMAHRSNVKGAQYTITATGRRGLVLTNLWEMAQAGKSISASDIDVSWTSPYLTFVIEPMFPSSTSDDEPNIPSKITAVQLDGTNDLGRDVPLTVQQAQPLVTQSRTWRAKSGASVDYDITRARFDPNVIGRFAPAYAITITLKTEAGERSCYIWPNAMKNVLKEQRPQEGKH